MEDKRRAKRLPLKLELTISSLFKQDYELISNINENIEVKNISKTGIGFVCNHDLPVSYYFDAKVQLADDKFFHTVIKILRFEKTGEGYSIGCEFVGLADILSMKVDQYEKDIEKGN
jgi:hypothetical protein